MRPFSSSGTTYSHTSIVDLSCEEMFHIVNDVESYPEFISFCNAGRLDQTHADGYTASIEFHIGKFSKHITTRNFVSPYSSVSMKLVSGPFKRMNGTWTFSELGKNKCQVNLEVEYEFSNRATALALGPFTKTLPKVMLESFKSEAKRRCKTQQFANRS